MKKTVNNLKGFRDFLPAEKRARDYVQAKVVETFTTFGFAPLETPTLEYASLLLGKYGDEADKLVYSFKDRGDREVALRYDQTVPTARVLAQYQGKLPKYFRRYQIQNVFRADKPQKGRYREFTQCDIDIFGTTSSISDAEILACSFAAFKNVGFPQVEIRINDRQTLFSALREFATDAVDVFSLIQSVDKLDKLPPEKVVEELVSKGLTAENASQALDSIMKADQSEYLAEIIEKAQQLGIPEKSLVFTPTLARGLDYYTGMIFEIMVPVEEFAVGSFGGGGRYDNLINELGGVEIPAVGVAFGFDRMVGAAQALGIVPGSDDRQGVMIASLEDTLDFSLDFAQQLRTEGVSCEVYPALDKLGKQLKYADQQNYQWIVIAGSQEVEANTVTLKNMNSGEQTTVSIEDGLKTLKQ